MRNVGSFLSLTLAAAVVVACQSTRDHESSDPEPAMEATPIEASAPRAGSASMQGQEEDFLEDEWERLTLAEQRKVFLVDQHLANARELRDRLELEAAREEVLRALELDPDNLEAKDLFSELGALLGDPAGEIETVSDELARQYELKVQQLRSEAEESLRKGKLLLGRGDYDAAIAEFTLTLDHIRWAPYSIDWGGLREEAQEMLRRSQDERRASAERQRIEAQRESFARLQEEERAQRHQRQARVNSIIASALAAFEAADYESAQELAEQALQVEPRNERAAELRDTSFRAGREKVREDYLVRKREQFARWEEELEEIAVPYTDVITMPDADVWRANTELRKRRTGLDLEVERTATEQDLLDSLTELRIPGLVIEEEESLIVVVDTLRTLTGLPLVVDPLADEAAFDEGAIYDFDLQNPITVHDVLNLIAGRSGPEVDWTVRHDAILFTTTEKVRGQLVIYNHDVQDLIFGLTDFIGPRINRLRLLDELEDDDGGGPFGSIDETTVIIEADALITLVQENVAKDSWDADGVSLDVYQGNMIVVQSPDVQLQIRQFLEDLRRFSSSMVTIESKFITIEDNWLQEIGVEFRGLDNPSDPFTDLDDVTNGLEDMASAGLDNGGTGVVNNASGAPSAGFFYDDGEDGNYKGHTSHLFGAALGSALSNIGGLTAQWTFLDDAQVSVILRMIEKSSRVELVNDQVLSVQNTQRAYVTVINQRAYIQDFDVEVANQESIANPEINVLTEGIVLDVRPTIHHDRKYLTLEVQPTVADVVEIRTFSTSLGSNTSPVEFQLPELEVQSVYTTAVVPDGGSILIGGLSRLRNIERRAEVPVLAKIPVVGLLFKEEGYSDEKSSLMVLIRAWITDVREELAKYER